MGQDSADPVQIINAVYFFLFVFFLVVGAFAAGLRLGRYFLSGERPPLLLWESVIEKFLLAIPFAGILAFRMLGMDMQKQAWWVIPSGAAAVIAMATFAFFEIFLVEKDARKLRGPDDPRDPRRPGDPRDAREPGDPPDDNGHTLDDDDRDVRRPQDPRDEWREGDPR